MAGPDPGMVVRVAADISDFERMLGQATAIADAAFQDISAAADGTATDQRDVTAAVADSVAAYDRLEAEGVPALRSLDRETENVGGATDSMTASMTAAGAAIGATIIAAELIGAALRTAAGWAKEFVVWVGDVSGVTDDATAAWEDFKQTLGDSIAQTGVIKAGYDSLKASILQAFGGDTHAAIDRITAAVNAIGIKAVDVALVLVDWAGTAARLFGMVKGPIDALTVAFNYVVTGFLDGVALMAGAASHLPFVGDEWAEVQARISTYADSWREVRDRTVAQMQADDAMTKGQGAVHEALRATTAALVSARDAMEAQQTAAAAAAASTQDLATANAGLVEGTGQAVVALYTQNEQLEKMDEWNRKIKNSHPFGVLLDGLTKVLPPLDTVSTKAGDAAAAAFLLGDHMSKAAPKLTGLGQAARDMSDDVRFATEVVANATQAALSFSDAMDLVQKGQGTMTGQIPTGPTRRNAFGQVDTDPYGWMWDTWRAQQATWFPGMALADVGNVFQVGSGGGSTTTQNINVNTVMGDKHEIARLVKEALADDWRSTGVRA